ncbi:MAG: amidohydrolase family protein [Acidimicrobiia bacterium]|nr:amidohydrolase family protein [Acidimicrobiia bacterium]
MMNRDWLATATEQAIEPELEIVDPHHHMWDTETRYGRYELDDLWLDTGAGHNVVDTVFIDCGANYLTEGPEHLRPVGETIYMAGRAAESEESEGATIAAIVSHADLTLGAAVTEVLDAHVEAAGGRFRGIRHSGARVDDDAVPTSRVQPPPDLYRQESFQEGARALAQKGLSFEAWQYHPQLDMVVDLARSVPELTIIVNHLGGPVGVGRYADARDEVLADLREGLTALAAHNNVSLKVGGIGMTRFGARWHEIGPPPTSDQLLEEWADTLRFAIDAFGPGRCMFESNFPVDGETTGYVALWNAFKKVSADYSDDERADLFSGTARRIYRI